MPISGLLRMPRRIYTHPADIGWNSVDLITSVGSFVFAAGALRFVVDVIRGWRSGPSLAPLLTAVALAVAFAGLLLHSVPVASWAC